MSDSLVGCESMIDTVASINGEWPSVPLGQAIAMVDAWAPEFGFQLHQIARALRQGLRRQQAATAKFAEQNARLIKERDEYKQQVLDVLADTSAEDIDEVTRLRASLKLAQECEAAFQDEAMQARAERDDSEQRYSDLAERWGHEYEEEHVRLGTLRRENAELRREHSWMRDQLNRETRGAEDLMREFDGLQEENKALRYRLAQAGESASAPDEAVGAETERWTDRIWRACEAVPCVRGAPDGAGLDCPAPDYGHMPCCNLRVALLPGEPFDVDYLSDGGFIYLFEPSWERPGRVSVGCVRLVEPSIDGWDIEADALRFDSDIYRYLERLKS